MTNTLLQKSILFCITICFVFLPSILLRADEAEDAYQRGVNALGQNDYNQAVAEFSEAVKLKPDEAKYYGMLGTARLQKGDYEQGIADLKTAVKHNGKDIGATYEPTSKKELPPEALEHGRKQVAKMLKDRPGMAEFGEETNMMREWAARKFAGEDVGSLIDWDPTPPVHSDAEHLAPEKNAHGAILIDPKYSDGPKRGRPRSFEELWAGAVFELHNVYYAKEFVRMHKEASDGKISKDDFVAGILKYEVLAAQQTRAFYIQVFLPFAAKKNLPTDPALWFATWWVQPDDAIKQFTDKTAYPWRPYARDHDWTTVERYWRLREYDKAVVLLKQMCAESEDMPDHAEVHLWLGRCRLKQGENSQAVQELTASIRLDPHDASAFRLRAKAYRLLKETERAETDDKRAEELEKEEKEKGKDENKEGIMKDE